MNKGLRIPPVKEGEELDVVIEAVGEKGDGIAKKDNFVIFVPNTREGDRVRIRINRVLLKVAFGEVVGEAEGQEESSEQVEAQEEETEDSEDFGE